MASDMSEIRPSRFFAGEQLRALRARHALKQSELAARLGISASYLSQIENDDRPLTPVLSDRLEKLFPLDWSDIEHEDILPRRLSGLREAMSDPIFAEPVDPGKLARLAEQQPGLADRIVRLHAAYRHAGERLHIVDETMAASEVQNSRLPWEEVRDWFHLAGNYVDAIDQAAEALSDRLRGEHCSPSSEALERYLQSALSVSLSYSHDGAMRNFDAGKRHLSLDASQPAETRRFQLAHQLAAIALEEELRTVVAQTTLHSASARRLLFLGLANYAAGAILMPYARFRDDARKLRHDIDRLCSLYSVSFEQACHRLSTLQRPGARGVPFFFCRVDMAGNITKRHSATRLQFARFGGACPLWIVHEAVAIPDRILVQLAETPDGVRYVSMAKGLVKPSGRYDRAPRRYAVALGCETDHAHEFIYADGTDLASPQAATPIGISCRICPRLDCDQRAFPPNDREIAIDPDHRGIVPYRMG